MEKQTIVMYAIGFCAVVSFILSIYSFGVNLSQSQRITKNTEISASIVEMSKVVFDEFSVDIDKLYARNASTTSIISSMQTEVICLKYGSASDDCLFVRGLDGGTIKLPINN